MEESQDPPESTANTAVKQGSGLCRASNLPAKSIVHMAQAESEKEMCARVGECHNTTQQTSTLCLF